MSASREELGKLHRMLTQAFIRRLELKTLEDGSEMDFASSADLNAIANFLKQNSITADPEKDADLQRLNDEFERQHQRRQRKSAPSGDDLADEYVRQDQQKYH